MIEAILKYSALLAILFVIQLVYFKIADHYNIIDKPNNRSSHTSITLRGGGIIFYIGTLIWFWLSKFQYPWFFVGFSLIAIISFIDDLKNISSKLRLTVHFIAMLLMFYQWGLFVYPWYYTVLALILCTGIINAYNFMDGINGITGGYSLVLIGTLWYINRSVIHFINSEIFYFVVLSLLVFMFFNFRKKAKCFAGDVGSVSIAFIILFILGILIIQTRDFSYIILFAVYGIDSVLTIVHRLLLKENIFEAHRKHAYQIMANELKIPHLAVSSFYCLLQAIIIVGFFYFFEYRWIYSIAILLLLTITYVIFMNKYFHLHLKEKNEKICA